MYFSWRWKRNSPASTKTRTTQSVFMAASDLDHFRWRTAWCFVFLRVRIRFCTCFLLAAAMGEVNKLPYMEIGGLQRWKPREIKDFWMQTPGMNSFKLEEPHHNTFVLIKMSKLSVKITFFHDICIKALLHSQEPHVSFHIYYISVLSPFYIVWKTRNYFSDSMLYNWNVKSICCSYIYIYLHVSLLKLQYFD